MNYLDYLVEVEGKAETTAHKYCKYLHYIDGDAPIESLTLQHVVAAQWAWLAYRRYLVFSQQLSRTLSWLAISEWLRRYESLHHDQRDVNPKTDKHVLLIASHPSSGATVSCHTCLRSLSAPEDFHEELIRGIAKNVADDHRNRRYPDHWCENLARIKAPTFDLLFVDPPLFRPWVVTKATRSVCGEKAKNISRIVAVRTKHLLPAQPAEDAQSSTCLSHGADSDTCDWCESRCDWCNAGPVTYDDGHYLLCEGCRDQMFGD